MKERSIRARLTIWYVSVLALAVLAVAVGSFWLMRHSLVAAADATLQTRVDGVVQFMEAMQQRMGVRGMRDEIREYAQLETGRARLEVSDLAGEIVYRPPVPGWNSLEVERPGSGPAPLVFVDRWLGDEPVRVADTRVVVGPRTYHVVGALTMAPARDALVRLRWTLAVLVPVVLLIAGFGGYAISGRALRPVDRMTRAAQVITVRHLDRRLDVPPAGDELSRLAVTFNDMLARLQAAVAEMSRLTAEASHELRTPVALIRATAEVAISRDRSADDYRHALVDVLSHAERMSLLVGDLLTLARSDAGVEPEDRTTLDLTQVAREAVDDVRPAAAHADVALTADIQAEPIEMHGYADALRRLIVILLDNAVKYSRPGGPASIRVSAGPESPGTVAIEITDAGIGIDPADRPHVFDRFYRAASARQHASEGSGLGLAIARTIVERHHGSIAIGDGPHGKGCTVSVKFERSS